MRKLTISDPLPDLLFRRCRLSQEETLLLAEEIAAQAAALFGGQDAPAGVGDGVSLIAAERARQIVAEGWDASHDDWHCRGELAEAAACYAVMSHYTSGAVRDGVPPKRWPWDDEWWKPSEDRIRNLVKAGALIAAEIDRLQRTRPPIAPAARAGRGSDE